MKLFRAGLIGNLRSIYGDGCNFDELYVSERDEKTWAAVWMEGPHAWSFHQVPPWILPGGAWTEPWDETELHIHLS